MTGIMLCTRVSPGGRLLLLAARQMSSQAAPAPSADAADVSMAKPLKDMPGLRPLLGTSMKIAMGLEPYKDRSMEYYKKYGKIVYEKVAPGLGFVRVFDPEDVKFVYRNEGEHPKRAPLDMVVRFCKDRNLPIGLANQKGSGWHKMRKEVNKPMLRPRTINAYIPAQDQVASDLVGRIRQLRDANGEVPELMDEISQYTMEAVGVVLFDKRLHAVDPNMSPPEDTVQFVKSSKGIMAGVQKMIFGPPIYKIYKTKAYKEFESHIEYVFNATKTYIEETLERNNRGEMGALVDEADNVVLNLFKSELTKDEATMAIVDLFFASVDTTTNMMAFALNNIAIHPEVQNSLVEEISKENPEGSAATERALHNMHYLKAFIKENLRVNPIAVVIPRILEKDITLKGYRIPAGQPMFMEHGAISKMTEHIDEPDMFKPERWLRDDKDKPEIHPFSVMPFGFGVRMCIGRRLAEQEVYLAIIKILQNYKLEYHHEPIEMIPTFISRPDKPLRFKFVDRR